MKTGQSPASAFGGCLERIEMYEETAASECPFLSGCTVFNLLRKDFTKRVMIANYCHGEFTRCKRYEMRVAGRKPAPNLLPSGMELKAAGRASSPHRHGTGALSAGMGEGRAGMMKGAILACLQEFVESETSSEKWREIVAHAGVNAPFLYTPIDSVPEEDVVAVVSSLCEILSLPLETAADAFGEFWVKNYTQKLYWTFYLGVGSAKEFLLKLNDIHVKTTRLVKGAEPPRFEYEWENEKTLIMRYISRRNLLDFAIGLVRGVGKFYKEDLQVSKVGADRIRIEFP